MSQDDLAAIPDSNGDQQQASPNCPSCGSKLTRRSMRRTWKDRLKTIFGLWPYRCQMCNTRFSGPQDQESIARHNASTEEDFRERGDDARFEEEEARSKKDKAQ
jgi:ribosomal protein L37AE/L43A